MYLVRSIAYHRILANAGEQLCQGSVWGETFSTKCLCEVVVCSNNTSDGSVCVHVCVWHWCAHTPLYMYMHAWRRELDYLTCIALSTTLYVIWETTTSSPVKQPVAVNQITTYQLYIPYTTSKAHLVPHRVYIWKVLSVPFTNQKLQLTIQWSLISNSEDSSQVWFISSWALHAAVSCSINAKSLDNRSKIGNGLLVLIFASIPLIHGCTYTSTF